MNQSRHPSPLRLSPRLLLVAALPMLLSACTMRALIGMNVAADGSGVFEVSLAFDEELRTLMEQESDEPIDWSSPEAFEGAVTPAGMIDELPEEARTSAYSEGDFEGFTVSVDFSSLDELNQILSEAGSEEGEPFPFSITQPEEGRFELTTDGDVFGEAGAVEDEFEMIPQSMLEDLFDMQLQVQLPGELISTNADETTDDGVMVWRLNPVADEQVQPAAVSEVTSSSAVPLLIIIAVLVVAAVAAAIMFLRRASTSPAVATAPADESVGPADQA